VDFQLTALQSQLRDTTRQLCATIAPIEKLRSGNGFDAEVWEGLTNLGVFDLRKPEDVGGAGLGMADTAIVFEELGRALVPGPVVWSHLAADLEGIVPNSVVGGVVRSALASNVVEYATDLDQLVALDDRGVWLIDPKQLEWKSTKPFDPLTPIAQIPKLPEGELVGGSDVAERWLLEGAALVAAQLVGIAAAVCDVSVAYAKGREQFGRPVGSFQAIKHLLADMFCRAELARVQSYAAAVQLDELELASARRSVASAKIVAGEAAHDNSKSALQVHGGMGYTWEVGIHLYLKRAWVLYAAFGAPGQHADFIASDLA
jgi:alkylation response protein AidB-like acyl-CoA dehydrogenase